MGQTAIVLDIFPAFAYTNESYTAKGKDGKQYARGKVQRGAGLV